MKFLVDKNGLFIQEFTSIVIPPDCVVIETELTPALGDYWLANKWQAGDFKCNDESDLNVSSSHFIKNLMGFKIYGGIEVAETGLSAKFAAGNASDAEVELLASLKAVRTWLTTADKINLRDPLLSSVLDACIAIPQIGLTIDDKSRILRNEAYATP